MHSFKSSILLIAVLTSFFACTVQSKVIYVDENANGKDNGLSWINAFRFLQDALTVAKQGDKIRVAQGTYKPDQGNGQAPGDRERSFRLGNVVLKGGYAGVSHPDPNERNITEYVTRLSGDLKGDDDPNSVDTDDNSYRIVTALNGGSLNGVTISGGSSDSSGAGMVCIATDTKIANCTFRSNAAVHAGALYISSVKPRRVAGHFIGLSPTIINCSFINNSAMYGGAIVVNESNPTFRDCDFVGNSAQAINSSSGIGGAIRNISSNTKFFQCVFKENSAIRGGAVYNQGGVPTFTDCTFTANSVGNEKMKGSGSVLYNSHSNPSLTGCTFSENALKESDWICNQESSPILTGSLWK